ncbi:ejaculatory bulb-specific protein 3 isoform X2 [Aethina tumida]|uniref:ejaculatory bulb-specific protein 3 isoform X2 n=1 Tax=Aethina tumida TaxID=116153 RepID=UPI0021497D91|nr:ejaculatory bulb-specific protein 3 isoform X2 [Aethina tumida]
MGLNKDRQTETFNLLDSSKTVVNLLKTGIQQSVQMFKCNNNTTSIILVAIIPLVLCALPQERKYTTKYDDIDLDEIIQNERILKKYIDCLLDRGKCTRDGMILKKHMQDAIETDCIKCSKKQKEGSEYIIRYLIDNKPHYWSSLEEKYDPTESYRRKYLESRKYELVD